MRLLLPVLVGLMITLVTPTTLAAVPTTMNYQGYLADTSGAAVDTTVPITFNIYTTDTGGAALWTSAKSVTVSNGLFSVTLGETVPFPADLFDTPLWIGVTIDSDAEMTQRPALTSVDFAFNADELQGQPASAYDQSAHVTDTTNPHGVTAAQSGALTAADIASLQSDLAQALLDIAALQSSVTTLQSTVITNTTNIGNNDIDILNNSNNIATNTTDISTNTASIADNTAGIGSNSSNISTNSSSIAIINANTVLALDNLLTLDQTDPLRPAALFNGVNVQIVSGSGATDAAVNGTGNLIVGYDEISTAIPICSLGGFDNQTDCENNSGTWAASHKSGSHNVVIGRQHNYSRYGGLVARLENNVTGESASVTGGVNNTARGLGSSVSGGDKNIAIGYAASVSGGERNTAAGNRTCISGGEGNETIGNNSSITAGKFNTAIESWASVTGGENNTARGFRSSISGGENNTTFGGNASIGGGANITAVLGNDWQAGDTVADITGLQSDVTALQGNSVLSLDGLLTLDTTDPSRPAALFDGVNVQIVSGSGATDGVVNGTGNLIVGYDEVETFSSPVCSLGEYDIQTDCENNGGTWAASRKSGSHTVVIRSLNNYSRYSGLVMGFKNDIRGSRAGVFGGSSNSAIGFASIVVGGSSNTASGSSSTTSGGRRNTASGQFSSVSGGDLNIASGLEPSVSGGKDNTASGSQSSVSGGTLNTASGQVSSVSGGVTRSATNNFDWAAGSLYEDN